MTRRRALWLLIAVVLAVVSVPGSSAAAPTVATTATSTTLDVSTSSGQSTAACWWCWGIVGLFVAALLCVLWTHLKTHPGWTYWLPWFIVVFVWVPFLLAGLWWWQPAWWWLPLLAWFPIVAAHTWLWARRRSWWRSWHFAVAGAYLAALAVGLVVVGAPEWGLLLPLFWLPWVALWFGYRARRQPWFQRWMWVLGAGYVAWVFVWLAALTPSWAWWLPVVFVAAAWWWFAANHLAWTQVGTAKWSWLIPFTLLPFLTWWIPLWDAWWCIVIAGAIALSLGTWIVTIFRADDWWTGWLPWFIVVFVWVPYLLAGLWFFQPSWWGWALVPWFLVVPGFAYWWASRRSWWDASWMWYAVLAYLVVAGGAAFIVGSPAWGVLFPLLWLPWFGLWFWYRRRQPWFRSWMWWLGLGYVFWMFWWVIGLTPRWGWWFPILFLPFVGWWLIPRRHGWDLTRRKACFVVPWSLLPWLVFMAVAECGIAVACCR